MKIVNEIPLSIDGSRAPKCVKHLLGYRQIAVRPMAVKDAEHQLNLEISENEARKDFSKAERIDYARRLERIESLKAKGRMSDGGKVRKIFLTLKDKPEIQLNLIFVKGFWVILIL